jgi:hypothetical protein
MTTNNINDLESVYFSDGAVYNKTDQILTLLGRSLFMPPPRVPTTEEKNTATFSFMIHYSVFLRRFALNPIAISSSVLLLNSKLLLVIQVGVSLVFFPPMFRKSKNRPSDLLHRRLHPSLFLIHVVSLAWSCTAPTCRPQQRAWMTTTEGPSPRKRRAGDQQKGGGQERWGPHPPGGRSL